MPPPRAPRAWGARLKAAYTATRGRSNHRRAADVRGEDREGTQALDGDRPRIVVPGDEVGLEAGRDPPDLVFSARGKRGSGGVGGERGIERDRARRLVPSRVRL